MCRALLPALAWRIRTVEAQASRRATLDAMGTLAAGSAHELNNPAAVVSRGARELSTTLLDLLDDQARWGASATPDERAALTGAVADTSVATVSTTCSRWRS